MVEKFNEAPNQDETQRFTAELAKWKDLQVEGGHSNDPEAIINSIVHQIEYLSRLGRIIEARALLDDLPGVIDYDNPYMREMITDAFVMVDDVDYYYDWYKENFSEREPNSGDQILVYGLLCYNRNGEALQVFERSFPALRSVEHFKYALQHIPKLIENKEQRVTYYQAILEASQYEASVQTDGGERNRWYEIALQAQYCLADTAGFEKTVQAIAETSPGDAKKHFDFLERLRDSDNPKWKVNKVFGIGLSKTGTSSLSKAMTLLGFSTAHWTNPYSHDLLTMDDIPLFDSLTDISITYRYKQIYDAYPDAKFVLSSRDVARWEKSFLTHYRRSTHAKSFADLREIITNGRPARFGQRYLDMHQELYFQHENLQEAYFAHQEDVLDFFRGKEDQLLMLDVSEPNALEALASFLEVDAPRSDFPHENTKEEKTSWVSPISGVTRRFKSQT